MDAAALVLVALAETLNDTFRCPRFAPGCPIPAAPIAPDGFSGYKAEHSSGDAFFP